MALTAAFVTSMAACVIACIIVCVSVLLLQFTSSLQNTCLHILFCMMSILLRLLTACNVTCMIKDDTLVPLSAYLLCAYVYDTSDDLFYYMCTLVYRYTHDMWRVSQYLCNDAYYWLPKMPYSLVSYIHYGWTND